MKSRIVSSLLLISNFFVSFSFSTGIVVPGGIFTGFVVDCKIDSLGRILVLGTSSDSAWTLARFTSNGALDTSFNSAGTPGYVTNDSGTSARGLALQPDGQILVVGYAHFLNIGAVLVRYSSDGNSSSQVNLFYDPTYVAAGIAVGIDNTETKIVSVVVYRNLSNPPPLFLTIACSVNDINSLEQLSFTSLLSSPLSGYSDPTKCLGSLSFKPASNQVVVGVGYYGYEEGYVSLAQRLNFPYGDGDIVFPALPITNACISSTVALEDTINFKVYENSEQTLYVTDGTLSNGTIHTLTTVNDFPSFFVLGSIGLTTGGSTLVMAASSSAMSASGIEPCLGRFITSTGEVDTTFGTGGITIQTDSFLDLGTFASFGVQDDGKIVAVGKGETGWVLARYDGNGILDKSFGANLTGVFLDSVAPLATTNPGSLVTTAIDLSEKLVIAGNYNGQSLIARYNLTGNPRDTAFNGTGVALGDLSPTATIYKVINDPVSNGYFVAGVSDANRFTTALYTNAGSLDWSYGTMGIVQESSIGEGAAYDMLLNGTALAVSGYMYTNTPVVINYESATGERDTSFGSNGLQQFPVLGNGTIYGIQTTTGISRYGAGQGTNSNEAFVQLLVDTTGVLQDSAVPFNTGLAGLIATTTIDQSGKLVVAGNYGTQSQITRYNMTGSPRDSDFGINGVALGYLVPTATINQVINKGSGYLVAGVSSAICFTTALYDNAGNLDPSYGIDGIVRETEVGISNASSMLLDGPILAVSGYTNSVIPSVINYDSLTGNRYGSIGNNGLQEFSELGEGAIYGINTTTGTSRYGAGQDVNSDTAFVKLLVNTTGVLQDRAAPFDTESAGSIVTTIIDRAGKLVVAGCYGVQSQITRYNLTGSPRDTYFGRSNGVSLGDLEDAAIINKVINTNTDGYLVAGVSGNDKFTTALYISSGHLDEDYGSGGIVQEATVGVSAAYDMLLNGTALAVSGYVYTNTPVVINYESAIGVRNASIGNNGLQKFPVLGNGTIYGIQTATGTSWYGAGQGTDSNDAFMRLLVDGTGVLQDTASPFSTSLGGLITTTTIDQGGKLLAGGNYGGESQLTRYNVTGSPRDTTFNGNGVASGPMATINKVITTDSFGYLVAGVGGIGSFTTALYTNGGELNRDYNVTGIVQEFDLGEGAAYDMLLNGTALAVSGYIDTDTPSVINYNSQTGARDSSFYNNGLQQFPSLGNGTIYGISTTTGTARYGAGQGTNSNTAFVRLLINGTGVLQDTASPFNTGQPGLIYSTTLTQTGNILAAVAYNSTWQVVNYLPNATRNTSFGTSGNGLADEPGFIGSARPRAIAVDSVGRIIAAGTSMVLTTSYITVVRYNPDGTVDAYVQETTLPSGGSGLGILVNNDDSITVAGFVDPGTGPTPIIIDYDNTLTQTNVRQYDALIPGYFFAVQVVDHRYYAAGATVDTVLLYPLLDGTGLLQDTAAPFDTDQNAVIYGGCIDQDDNITMCGNYDDTWAIVKYTSVGERYVGFGSNGVVLQSSLGIANAYAVHQDAQGNYFVAGESTVNGVTVLTVAKYANDGSPVTAFGVNGVAQLTTYGQSRAFNLTLNSNGSILVAGQVTINGTEYAAFVAYDASGNLISSFGSGGVQTYSKFGPGSLYANLINTSGSAIGAGQMGNVATLVQTLEESTAAAYIHSGL